jgi:hypothetical protein
MCKFEENMKLKKCKICLMLLLGHLAGNMEKWHKFAENIKSRIIKVLS